MRACCKSLLVAALCRVSPSRDGPSAHPRPRPPTKHRALKGTTKARLKIAAWCARLCVAFLGCEAGWETCAKLGCLARLRVRARDRQHTDSGPNGPVAVAKRLALTWFLGGVQQPGMPTRRQEFPRTPHGERGLSGRAPTRGFRGQSVRVAAPPGPLILTGPSLPPQGASQQNRDPGLPCAAAVRGRLRREADDVKTYRKMCCTFAF